MHLPSGPTKQCRLWLLSSLVNTLGILDDDRCEHGLKLHHDGDGAHGLRFAKIRLPQSPRATAEGRVEAGARDRDRTCGVIDGKPLSRVARERERRDGGRRTVRADVAGASADNTVRRNRGDISAGRGDAPAA